MCCSVLRMLEAEEGELCLLEVLAMLEAMKLMRYVLLWILEAGGCALCARDV